MKFYVVVTYQRGNILVKAMNKHEAIRICNDEELNVINVMLLSTYCRENKVEEGIVGEVY